MKVTTISKRAFSTLQPLDIPKDVFNTEAKIFNFEHRGERKIIKSLYHIDGEKFANKLYTIELLDSNRIYLPNILCIPDTLLSVAGEIKGFTIPHIEGVNLTTILGDNKISVCEHIYYLKKIGELLEQLKNIRQYTPLKDFYINDLHDSNFIVNPNNRSITAVDLDSSKIGSNTVFPARFLKPSNLLEYVNKYQRNPENNGLGYFIPDANTDLYCYILMILNYLFGSIRISKISQMSANEFYEYLNYLSDIGINKELLDIIGKIVDTCPNENPVNYLDTITSENVCRARENVYKLVKKRMS